MLFPLTYLVLDPPYSKSVKNHMDLKIIQVLKVLVSTDKIDTYLVNIYYYLKFENHFIHLL